MQKPVCVVVTVSAVPSFSMMLNCLGDLELMLSAQLMVVSWVEGAALTALGCFNKWNLPLSKQWSEHNKNKQQLTKFDFLLAALREPKE